MCVKVLIVDRWDGYECPFASFSMHSNRHRMLRCSMSAKKRLIAYWWDWMHYCEERALVSPMKHIWHRVVSITPKRMAAQDSLAGQIQALQRPVFLNGLHSIGRTCGCVAAWWRGEWRNATSIESYGQKNQKDACGSDSVKNRAQNFHSACVFMLYVLPGSFAIVSLIDLFSYTGENLCHAFFHQFEWRKRVCDAHEGNNHSVVFAFKFIP